MDYSNACIIQWIRHTMDYSNAYIIHWLYHTMEISCNVLLKSIYHAMDYSNVYIIQWIYHTMDYSNAYIIQWITIIDYSNAYIIQWITQYIIRLSDLIHQVQSAPTIWVSLYHYIHRCIYSYNAIAVEKVTGGFCNPPVTNRIPSSIATSIML